VLSYQHRYHAGNVADVHKHLVLTALLRALARKEGGFCFLDLHAGEGVYDLTSPEARKLGEAADGIEKLYHLKSGPPAVMDYLACVRAENRDGKLRFYPGSPRLAERLSRSQDELVLIELHPQAYAHLKRRMGHGPRIHIHRRDALEALGALMPPHLKRGLVLIDPSYEDKDDYDKVLAATLEAQRRWPQGIYVIWYPLLPADKHQVLLDGVAKTKNIGEVLLSEWTLKPKTPERGLRGSGMIIINPPFKLDERLRVLSDWLTRTGFGPGPYRLEWLAKA
jgi:23S rRNA (adenine2030-N6)-methyltransferase